MRVCHEHRARLSRLAVLSSGPERTLRLPLSPRGGECHSNPHHVSTRQPHSACIFRHYRRPLEAEFTTEVVEP
jgi:hypothetical protein